MKENLNMTMLCDFYELTMGNGYFASGYRDRITYFDIFFRQVPDNGGYAIAAGLEQIIMDYCRKNIAKYAMPYEIEFRDDFPKTLVGKVAYRVLEEQEENKEKTANRPYKK